MSTVPAYSASGRRVRNYSLAAVETLLAQKRCSVKRAKNGRITSAQLFPLTSGAAAADEKTPLRKTIHVGQRYSHRQQVDEAGHRAWRHVPLLTPRTEEAELFLLKIFRAVPLSCLTPEPEALTEEEEILPPDYDPPPVAEMKPRRRALPSSDAPVTLAA